MTFQHPYLLFLLLPVPLLIWWRIRRRHQATFLYSSVDLFDGVPGIRRSYSAILLSVMRWTAVVLAIVALARPQLTQSETTVSASGIDIVLALDLSGSMESEDFFLDRQRVNRLAVAKDTLRKFIQRRPNDRIGLVAFAGRAYIAAPLTLDHDFLLTNLQRLELHTIEDGTAIGSALAAAINRVRDLKSKSKVVILMTDGQNNAGKVPPLTAAEAAQALKVKVYAIGVGTRGSAPMPRMNMFGQKVYVQVPVDIDEETLRAIAEKTNGKYYRADNTDTLRTIYSEIDQLEKTEAEVKKYVRREELFPWFILPALGLLLVETLLANTIWRRLP